MPGLAVSVILSSNLVTVQLGYAVCCAVIWGRMSILTVLLKLSSKRDTVQLGYGVCSYGEGCSFGFAVILRINLATVKLGYAV
jgi:hypothetical protein